MKNRRWTTILILSAAITAARPTCAAPATPPLLRTDDETQSLVSRLKDPDSAVAQREEAARRLLQRPGEQALVALRGVLDDLTNPRGQLAVARAIAMQANPDPALVAPLEVMIGPDRALTEAATEALSNFRDNPGALRLLTTLGGARQQREAMRMLAIRAIANVAQKSAAEFLISLLASEDENQRIRSAAIDALTDMTGHTEFGRDPQQWLRWWSANVTRSEGEWKTELLANQAARFTQFRGKYDELVRETELFLTERYLAAVTEQQAKAGSPNPTASERNPAAADQQADLLLRYLGSANAQVRRVGATIIHDEAMAARRVPPAAREYLRKMIVDSDRDVRIAASTALRAINDPQALDALLGQLNGEQDPEVRAALAAPLASIGDLRAVPALRTLVHDPYTTTAAAAAAALKELGPIIREKAPQTAQEIAMELKGTLEELPPGPGTLALREAIVDAMVPLREPALMPTFYRLLRETTSVRVRWAALRALGEIGEAKSGDTIAGYLEDRENGVRLEALRALGNLKTASGSRETSAADHAEEIYKRMDPAFETDPSVREQAWAVLQPAFLGIALEQLPTWADRFEKDPARRIIVLRAMVDRYNRPQDADPLAAARQRLGMALMDANQPAEAAKAFKPALDYWRVKNPEHMVTEQLVEQYLKSLLYSRQYAEAVSLAGELVKTRISYQQTAGASFRTELDRLRQTARNPECLALIEQIRKMAPPLAPLYQEAINTIELEIRRTTSQPAATQPTPGP